MRLFYAINFSDEMKSALKKAISDVRNKAISGNFSRPENLHLTLAFVGEVRSASVAQAALAALTVSPFTLTLSDTGILEGRGDDIYYVGIEKNPALISLSSELRQNLDRAGVGYDRKPFKPHITIGREVVSDTVIHADVMHASMTVTRVILMKSEHIRGKLTYTEIAHKELQ